MRSVVLGKDVESQQKVGKLCLFLPCPLWLLILSACLSSASKMMRRAEPWKIGSGRDPSDRFVTQSSPFYFFSSLCCKLLKLQQFLISGTVVIYTESLDMRKYEQ